MVSSLSEIISNKYGKKVLIYLLSPRDPAHLLPEIIQVLEKGDGNAYRYVVWENVLSSIDDVLHLSHKCQPQPKNSVRWKIKDEEVHYSNAEAYVFPLIVRRMSRSGGRSCWRSCLLLCWSTCVRTLSLWSWIKRVAWLWVTSWAPPSEISDLPWRLWRPWQPNPSYREDMMAR